MPSQTHMRIRRLALILAFAPQAVCLFADEDVDYSRDIKPIFKAHCFSCHGALKQESGLRLDTAQLMLKGGENGPAIVARKVGASPLVSRLETADESLRMPPEGKPLKAQEIQVIKDWITAGAVAPPGEQPEPDPRKHWAFRRPIRAEIPRPANSAWAHNPIDAFVAAAHELHQLAPLPTARKEILLRRVYLDLIGLPPTPAELHAFLTDKSPSAYEKVVDRLLGSKHYGERWGRHWMDVWRYSDWYGRRQVNDVRNSYPHIWRWRDWIIQSLNDDKGYDQMLREMLAADELYPEDDARIPALGFIVRNWFSLNYDTWKQDLVEHTGKAFLGLRLNCAHCHDHKYDPISQQEYFQFRAFFEPLEIRHDRVPGGPALSKYLRYRPGSGGSLRPIEAGLPRVYDHFFDDKTFMYRLGDTRDRMDGPPVQPAGLAILGGDKLTIQEVNLPPVAWYPGLKPFAQQAEINQRQQAITAAEGTLAKVRSSAIPGLQRQIATAEKELAVAQNSNREKSESKPTTLPVAKKDVVAHWRFEGANDSTGFLADSSGNNHTLHRITGTDPVVVPAKLAQQQGVRTLQLKSLLATRLNEQAAEFQQQRSFAYLGAKADSEFFANQFSFECLVHFDVSQENFNRTIAAYDGCWTLLHRGIDSKRFELRVRYSAESGKLRDVATGQQSHPELPRGVINSHSKPLILNTASDYYICLVMAKDTVTLWVADLAARAQLRAFEFPRSTASDDFSKLARPEPSKLFKIGNSDGTGRVDGLIDEVRLSRIALTSTQVAAIVGQPADNAIRQALNKLNELKSKQNAFVTSLAAAEANLSSAKAELQAVVARVDADRAKFGQSNGNTKELARQAAKMVRTAKLMASRAKLAQAQKTLIDQQNSGKPDAKAIKQGQQAAKAARQAIALQEKDAGDTKSEYEAFGPQYPKKSSGRRRALAQWIADPSNPLTARVAVNHMWLRHFGRPLVESVFDFGRSGQQPTHPKLLDWLAVELMEHADKRSVGNGNGNGGWKMKHLHRLIVTSRTYQLSSRPGIDHVNLQRDKNNSYLWKFNRRRLESEIVRDSLLHLSGQLDSTIGGQDLDPKLEATSRRRSMYFSVYPEGGGMMRFMSLFDAPDPCDCYRRSETIVPQQALAMSNSTLSLNMSKQLAIELAAGHGLSDAEFIVRAFERILCRLPTTAEKIACDAFLDGPRTRQGLVRVLLNHNDFVTVH